MFKNSVQNLISEKKKKPLVENFIKYIQSNIQEYIKSIIILPEENIREGQNNFYKDEFRLLIDNNEDFRKMGFRLV